MEQGLEKVLQKGMYTTLKIQSVAIKALTDYLHNNRFMQMMPVMLSTVTDPLCHSVYDADITYLGQKLQLTKSMILHKQLALTHDSIDKIYILSPNIRLETADCRSSGRHLIEFSQLDIEHKYWKKKDFMQFAEQMVCYAISEVKEKCEQELSILGRSLTVPKKPFKVYDSADFKKPIRVLETELSASSTEPFWIVNHEREFYDYEDKQRKGYYHNYDLIWPEGYGEALSGGEREFEYSELTRKMLERKMDLKSYKPYLEVAKKGLLKPSAGGGLGIERFVRFLTGKKHIADVSPFAKVPGSKIIF